MTAIDLDKKLKDLAERIGGECKSLRRLINSNNNNLNDLNTDSKQSIVSAINELNEVVNNLEDSIQNTDLGWATAENTINDINNPFIVTINQEFTLPIRNDSGLYSQSTNSIQNLIDNDTNELIVSNLNDLFFIRIHFKLKTALANREGKLWIDIGNQKFNFENFKGNSDASTYENVSINMHFYQYISFLSNRGKIKGTLDGNAELFDLVLLIEKKFNGKNL